MDYDYFTYSSANPYISLTINSMTADTVGSLQSGGLAFINSEYDNLFAFVYYSTLTNLASNLF